MGSRYIKIQQAMKYYSQFGQDPLDRELENPNNKYFVDVGASHRSNAYRATHYFLKKLQLEWAKLSRMINFITR